MTPSPPTDPLARALRASTVGGFAAVSGLMLAAKLRIDPVGSGAAVLLPISAVSALLCSWGARNRNDLRGWVDSGFVAGGTVVFGIAVVVFLLFTFATTWTF